jgi:hypothetical protein
MGAPVKSFRIALGSLLIKEKLNITDEETIDQIRENHICNILKAWKDIGMKSRLIRRCSFISPSITHAMLGEINEQIPVRPQLQ